MQSTRRSGVTSLTMNPIHVWASAHSTFHGIHVYARFMMQISIKLQNLIGSFELRGSGQVLRRKKTQD